MSEKGALSLRALERETDELRKDYASFIAGYEIIKKRIEESTELQPPRMPMLHTWSGARAVCGSLELSLNAIERTIVEYDELIRKVKNGEIDNTDLPSFTVLDGGIS